VLKSRQSALEENEKKLSQSLKDCEVLRSTLIETVSSVSESMKRKWLDDYDIRERIRQEVRAEVSADLAKADVEAVEEKCSNKLALLHSEEINHLKQSYQNEHHLLREQLKATQQKLAELNDIVSVKVKEAALAEESKKSLLLAHSEEIIRLDQSHQSAINLLQCQLANQQQRLAELQSSLAQKEEALIFERLKNRLPRTNPSPTPVELSIHTN
jgi:hypothetical protein